MKGYATPVGGGFDISNFTTAANQPFFSVVRDGPSGAERTKWTVAVRNTDVAPHNLGIEVYAVCVTALP